jgi:uncharacterized protein
MDKQRPKRKLPSVIRWILWVLLVQFILFNLSAALYAYKFTHVIDDTSFQKSSSVRNVFVKTWRLFSGPRQFRSLIKEYPAFPYDTITLKTKNGISIDTWYAKTDSGAKGTVILFHGIMANKGMFLPEAAEFLYQGFNVMLVDFRAHGNSSGHITTIGVKESEEVKLAYEYIVLQGEKNIFLYGNSMGAVVVAKAISDHDLKPAGVFLDMPFASLQTHLRARARSMGFRGFAEKPFGFLVTLWIGIEKGFNGFKYQTTSYVSKINCPVLMQWGANDEYVLKNETDRIFSAIATADKKLVIYDHAGHESFLQNDPVIWRIETEKFLIANSK